MYQYSRAIYRSIKDLIDPYVDPELQLDYRRSVLEACEQTMERLARDPHYFANPDRALFQDIRRYFPITHQAQVAWAVNKGVAAAVSFIDEQIESGALDGASPAAARPRARASRASARRCRTASTARRISISRLASRRRRSSRSFGDWAVRNRPLSLRSRGLPIHTGRRDGCWSALQLSLLAWDFSRRCSPGSVRCARRTRSGPPTTRGERR